MVNPQETIVLRDALRKAVDYLGRLPATLATYEQIQHLQRALQASEPAPTMGEYYDPAGHLVVRAFLDGDTLHLATELQADAAGALHKALANGIELQLGSTAV
ncbi:hypothetical protein [Achromobacter ruhlandii]|uniref:hypothetical protein n=1 Tax=Achromobacter ruhlandii TaxID=72557 RepID=UPI003B9ED57E